MPVTVCGLSRTPAAIDKIAIALPKNSTCSGATVQPNRLQGVDCGILTRMSERNGEKSRFQINRKRAVLRRAKIRELLASAGPGAVKRPAHSKPARAKG